MSGVSPAALVASTSARPRSNVAATSAWPLGGVPGHVQHSSGRPIPNPHPKPPSADPSTEQPLMTARWRAVKPSLHQQGRLIQNPDHPSKHDTKVTPGSRALETRRNYSHDLCSLISFADKVQLPLLPAGVARLAVGRSLQGPSPCKHLPRRSGIRAQFACPSLRSLSLALSSSYQLSKFRSQSKVPRRCPVESGFGALLACRCTG